MIIYGVLHIIGAQVAVGLVSAAFADGDKPRPPLWFCLLVAFTLPWVVIGMAIGIMPTPSADP